MYVVINAAGRVMLSSNLEGIKGNAASVSSLCRHVASAGAIKSCVVTSSRSCATTRLKRIINAFIIILIVDVGTAVGRCGRRVGSTSGWPHWSWFLLLRHRPSRIPLPRMLQCTKHPVNCVSTTEGSNPSVSYIYWYDLLIIIDYYHCYFSFFSGIFSRGPWNNWHYLGHVKHDDDDDNDDDDDDDLLATCFQFQ